MRRNSFFPILLLMAAAQISPIAPAAATSYTPVSDERLTDQASLVVSGTVEQVTSSSAGSTPSTEYRLKVDRRIKGRFQGDTLTFHVLGGPTGKGSVLVIQGAPRFAKGSRALLFLGTRQDGSLRPLHLALGVFHEVEAGGRRLAVRNLSEMTDLSNAAGSTPEGAGLARDADRFAGWIADRVAGRARRSDYFVKLPEASLRMIQQRFSYIDPTTIFRWFDFDRRANVDWLAHQDGFSTGNLAGQGFEQLKAAINAWNSDAGSNVRYRYVGTTSITTGFSNEDGRNVLTFTDHDEDYEEDYDCRSGGVLAIGGFWGAETGPQPRPITEGAMVVNDNAECWLSSSSRVEQIFGHELGHTLGLGHSCGDDDSGPCDTPKKSEAMMRAFAFGGSRGASLRDDDREGIASLYPDAAHPDKPAAPSGLAATVLSQTSIQLTWTDNSTNEAQFRVEVKSTGSFKEVTAPAANATTATITGLKAGTAYTFRVRARNEAGFSAYSNEATATTLAEATVPAAPANLVAERVSAASIRLTWEDRSTSETEFLIERATPEDSGSEVWRGVGSAPANSTSLLVRNLGAESPHTFRIRAINLAGSSPYSNLASATTTTGTGPCVPGATSLCLGGDRFRVEVQWRQSGIGAGRGAGTAVPLAGSDQTGLFWFFDSTNIELIVKMLDGTSINDFYWSFYGGLSDVEYWITVTDTVTGESRTYYNSKGNVCGGSDTRAFPGTLPAPLVPAFVIEPAVTAAACAPNTLCLLGGRFQVEVSWKLSPTGPEGAGTPVPIAGSDQTGMFWFFEPSNIELVVKVLNGQAINGKHWVFYGALSDVEYEVRVTDTTTGAVKTYRNERGNICGRSDTNAF
jgi:hypothetical protein